MHSNGVGFSNRSEGSCSQVVTAGGPSAFGRRPAAVGERRRAPRLPALTRSSCPLLSIPFRDPLLGGGLPRVASLRSQPRAMECNSFGVPCRTAHCPMRRLVRSCRLLFTVLPGRAPKDVQFAPRTTQDPLERSSCPLLSIPFRDPLLGDGWPRVASPRSQPWALECNSFGVLHKSASGPLLRRL